jgi:signal transduction histidine kinase
LEPEQGRAIGVMSRSADRLERLIEDLLMFSMQERGEVTLRLSSFNLKNSASDLLHRMAPKAEEKQIILFMESDSANPLVIADQEKITWVMAQLLENAIKFTPANGRVILRVTTEKPYYRITVEETGIGIPADKLQEIFEPFHQLDGSSTRRYGGTGLGLTLAHRIIEAHGSVITVASEVNKGTILEFLIKSDPASG